MGIDNLLDDVRRASRKLTLVDEDTVKQVLCNVCDALVDHTDEILEANAEDLRKMDPSDPKYDRLKLTKDRLGDMACCMANVACYPAPQGKELYRNRLANGLLLKKVRVPFGVVGVIYEARPNVTSDVFSLCLKSGNACVLKGGHEADCSNRAIVRVIHEVLDRFGIDRHTVELLPPDREATTQLLHAEEKVDLIIPRGSKGLIEYVRREATVPVIETGAGVCHAYFDISGDLDKGTAIVCNAKTRRVSVCNALDCLLINVHRLADLPHLCAPLAGKNVAIFADEDACRALQDAYPSHLLHCATDASFGTEFLDYKMAIRTVPDVDAAINHIEKYGSRHSESIITESKDVADYFCRMVDAACVYVNAPTSFTDGGQFGMGAEIGISTQKLHARGPMGLDELTTYKWVIEGNGQVRD